MQISVIMEEHFLISLFLNSFFLTSAVIPRMIFMDQSTFALITNTIIHCDKKTEWNMLSQYPTNLLRVNDDIDITGS